MERLRISSGSPWEPLAGYCRAVRAGPFVCVAGTTGTDASGAVVSPDGYAQAKRALERIVEALHQVGARVGDVIRTRMYVTDITQWEAIGRAHSEVFGHVPPASTMIEVRSLISPDMVVEIEADAVIET